MCTALNLLGHEMYLDLTDEPQKVVDSTRIHESLVFARTGEKKQ